MSLLGRNSFFLLNQLLSLGLYLELPPVFYSTQEGEGREGGEEGGTWGQKPEEGLTVNIKPWESGVDIFEAVTQDYYTLACAEHDRLLNAQAEGKPYKQVNEINYSF